MQQPDPVQIQHMMMAMVPVFMLFGLIAAAIIIIPLWLILKKAGMSPFLSLLTLLGPVGVIVLLYVLAFSEWKGVPAPEYSAGYPPAYPPPGYVPAAAYPPPTAYVPPPDPPATI